MGLRRDEAWIKSGRRNDISAIKLQFDKKRRYRRRMLIIEERIKKNYIYTSLQNHPTNKAQESKSPLFPAPSLPSLLQINTINITIISHYSLTIIILNK